MIDTIKKVSLALLLGVAFTAGRAQNENPSNLTSSPYTRYGMGKLGNVGNVITRGMGGLSQGVRSNAYTNLYNPASLTAIDTLTMIFDLGLEAQYGRYSENGQKASKWDAGFSYFSFHFPLWRNFAGSLSLTPYSMVGYEYGTNDSIPIESQITANDTMTYETYYGGTGGLSRAMASIAWMPLNTRTQSLSVGVNIGYIWGTVSNAGTFLINSGHGHSTFTWRTFTANGMSIDLGVQYTRLLSPTRSFTVGATFSPKIDLDIDAEIEKSNNSDTIAYSLTDMRMATPLKFGVGATFNFDRKWVFGADFSFENWKNVPGLSTNLQKIDDFYKNITKFAAGFEYRPAIIDQNYFKVCRYRAGISAKNSYIEVYGSQNWEYTVSAGVSFPVGQMSNRRSMLNLAIDYTHLAPSKSGLLSENYLGFSLGITFNEVMFFRNRLQ